MSMDLRNYMIQIREILIRLLFPNQIAYTNEMVNREQRENRNVFKIIAIYKCIY